jgi:hypothetical protein
MVAIQSAADAAELAARAYADEAAKWPNVAAIAASRAEGGLSVWTLIDGSADHTLRDRLYDLQLLTWQQHPQALIDFRVVDTAEYPAHMRSTLLPTEGQVLHPQRRTD